MNTSIPPQVYADDKRMTVIGSVVFCVLFATTMVALRAYTRTKIIRMYGVDDYLAVAALLSTVACGTTIALITYNFAMLFIKLSFLCQYYRVMVVPRLRKIYAVALLVVGAWATSQLFISALQCMPVSGFWDQSVKAKCIPNQPQWYVNAAGNIITDVAVFALPIPIFWHLSLPRKQKILLIGIFSLGFFTVAISIVRVQFLNISADFTWTNVEASLWSLGEISSAVTCACLPTLRPLLTKMFPGLMSRVNLSSVLSHQTDTRHTQPTRAYSSLPKPHDTEKGIAESGMSSARSSHLRDDRSTTYGLPYKQQTNESSETIFGLASSSESATGVESFQLYQAVSVSERWNSILSRHATGDRERES
ncbi:satratoxin biosynthesis SC1 cluster protein 4 [Colletotrichum spaethianum]|uniref:Satratoxin biosynthesis SC1 cluster protein 4 n=1 Tax=Colletotrichum spaethianum TaxID=700344 RepID=A0AA37LCZ1_9PEZI|nr:satratoxin biosynthesis SC1 cluster protein 4 [Colletotrichum spaethianum]GKT44088.1 satratoxin biosynthesis SC1 cluster protein 4 [Colletotrichum spaethianum]